MSDVASYQASEAGHPVRIVVHDDLRRSRLTVFFRLILALPHLIVVSLWAIVAFFVAIVGWFAALFGRRLPDGIHAFQERFLRYSTHVTAYLFLVADPFPRFTGEAGSYPVDLEVDGPTEQNRWTIGFRIILAIPALIIASVLSNLLQILAFVGWFYALATGRMSRGIRDLSVYCIRYAVQTYAYVLLLTERYPSLSGGPIAP
jgi:Domain of unknown function (DUF4389)